MAPVEPEPTPPAEAEEPLPEPVDLRPPTPEPTQEASQPVAPEPELMAPVEPEPTPPAEAAEPLPEPVDLRPSAPEPTQEAHQFVAPEPEPTPPAEAAEPVPEPVELRPPAPEPGLEAPAVAEPEPEPPAAPEPEQPAATVLDDRDELIESLRARVESQELELAKLRDQLEEERTRKDVQVHVWPEEQPVPTTPGPVQAEHYLLCVPTAAGYVLLDRVGGLPSVGQAVDVPEEEGRFTVTKVVRLPRNGRPCAYLQRA